MASLECRGWQGQRGIKCPASVYKQTANRARMRADLQPYFGEAGFADAEFRDGSITCLDTCMDCGMNCGKGCV
eukprot:365669-Chlamydomonas_euryale.AAC.9